MNFLWISPYYPLNFQPFIEKFDQAGMTVLGIGEEPYDQLGHLLQSHLTEYFRVDNLEDKDEVIRAVAFLIYKHGPIDRVESNNEHWLELDALIRQQFNISGLKPADLKKTKYKSEMKQLFKKCGAPVVEGALIKSIKDIPHALRQLGGLPVIAKPDLGVGASDTFKLETEKDLTNFKTSWNEATPYFLESFVSGELCTYDGLLDQNGNIVFEASFTHNIPTLDIMNRTNELYIVIERQIDPKLRAIAHRIIKEFGMTERFFHIEFFRQSDGSYITLEYNNRVTGGFVVDAYNHLFKHDLFRQYGAVVQGDNFISPTYEARLGVVATRRDDHDYKYSIEDIRNQFKERVQAVEPIIGILADMQGNEWILVTCEDKSEVDEVVEYIHTLA